MFGQMGGAGGVRIIIGPREHNQLHIDAVELFNRNHISAVQAAFVGDRVDLLGGSGRGG